MNAASEGHFVPLTTYKEYPVDVMRKRARDFYTVMKRRRTIRTFSDRPVPLDILEDCIRTAARAPSGANMQPWTFVIVSRQEVKERIRLKSEEVEKEFYSGERTRQWVRALAPLGTSRQKPFLTTAPYLIAVFAQRHGYYPNGEIKNHYYVQESVGIATGMLITAIHSAGLASLTYSPAKMGFLNRILLRPSNEKPFMILVVGYPAEDTTVPDLDKKNLEDVAVFL
ncbi:MAG: nitroreductase family protein [Desulfatiglandaceae bacterium]